MRKPRNTYFSHYCADGRTIAMNKTGRRWSIYIVSAQWDIGPDIIGENLLKRDAENMFAELIHAEISDAL